MKQPLGRWKVSDDRLRALADAPTGMTVPGRPELAPVPILVTIEGDELHDIACELIILREWVKTHSEGDRVKMLNEYARCLREAVRDRDEARKRFGQAQDTMLEYKSELEHTRGLYGICLAQSANLKELVHKCTEALAAQIPTTIQEIKIPKE